MARLFLILFLAITSILIALDPNRAVDHYNIQAWNMDSGLPNNSIFALQQTRDGYLWIGTQEGLVRFDGVHFEVFTRDTTPALKPNEVRALYEDSSGALWIGTSSGGLTRFKDGEFTTSPAAENSAISRIRAISEDRWGNLWIGSHSGGLACLKNGKFITYTKEQGLPDNQVRSIYKDKNRDLWVTTSKGIIKLLEPGGLQNFSHPDILPCLTTTCLYETHTGNLWIGTGESGLFMLKNGIAARCRIAAEVPPPLINALYKDSRDNLWIGMDGAGLKRLKEDVGLDCGSVYSITEDQEGNLWVGTLDKGLFRLRDNEFTTLTAADGLSHNTVQCIYESPDRTLWIGTQGGLNRIKDGKPTPILTSREGLLNNSISSLFADHAGCLWIGTLGGVNRFKDGKLTALTKKEGLSDNRVTCILEDKQGYTWIGTKNGLNRFDNSTGKLSVFTTQEGLSNNSIEFVFEDSDGEIWIGTNTGLNRMSSGVVAPYKLNVEIADYLLKCAYEDKEGNLWLGADRGLILARVKSSPPIIPGIPQTKKSRARLTEDYVTSILEDDKGYLWLAGKRGISRLAKKELAAFAAGKISTINIVTYNEKDGMKSHCCIGPACKARDGRLWFPTSAGATVIDPNRIETNPPPPSIIEKLIVDGESIKIKSFSGGEGGRFFKKAPLELFPAGPPEAISLSPGKKRIEFHYTAVSFINPQKIRFKIKLAGYDRDWVNVGNLRSAVYNGLSPGHYTFFAAACNQEGIWNPEQAALSLYLKPYFYQAAWFRITAFLLVCLGLFLIIIWRSGKLAREKRRLEQIVMQRTKEINDKNIQLQTQTIQLEEQSGKLKELDKIKSRFFANISHEFRTPLTLILGPLEQMLTAPQEEEKAQKKKMRLMQRNSQRLLGLINRLLELSKFDSGKMTLQAAGQNIVPFLKGILHSFDSLAVQKELELVFQPQAEDISIYYDAEKMEEVISNLLSNAFKFTPPGGRITLAVKDSDIQHRAGGGDSTGGKEYIEVSVSDTGPGIPAEESVHIFDRFYQADSTYEYHNQGSGIGLAIAKEIVELHHGVIEAISLQGETKGARFVIRLPKGKAHLKPEEIVTSIPTAKKPALPIPEMKEMNEYEPEDFAAEQEEEAIFKELEAQEKEIILVVEDSADMRLYIRGILEPIYSVVEAENGEEGMQKAREIVPDLIICDVMMPGMDGFEVCSGIKSDRTTSHIPIILLTAKAGEDNIITGLETGADDYITKPFNKKMLLARIRNLIELRRHWQQTWNREMTLQPTGMTESEVDKSFIKELKEVMEKNIPDAEFNVDQLCRKLYMSHATLYRKINAITGEPPTDFIRSYRLKRAAELLKKGKGSVLEVALEVGFSSANYFTKCFKRKFHRLPTEYIGQ